MTGDETFLSRWSRRKQAARTSKAEADEPQSKAPVPAPASVPAEALAETRPPADLPPIESLGKDSDYAPFLRDDVPDDLRRQALSRLWASDPAFAAPDPLDLYNLDHRPPALTEAVATLFRVGRGMVDPDSPAEPSPAGSNAGAAEPESAEPPAGLVAPEHACSKEQKAADFPQNEKSAIPHKKT